MGALWRGPWWGFACEMTRMGARGAARAPLWSGSERIRETKVVLSSSSSLSESCLRSAEPNSSANQREQRAGSWGRYANRLAASGARNLPTGNFSRSAGQWDAKEEEEEKQSGWRQVSIKSAASLGRSPSSVGVASWSPQGPVRAAEAAPAPLKSIPPSERPIRRGQKS